MNLSRDGIAPRRRSIALTQKEWALLRVVATHPSAYTLASLQSALYGFDDDETKQQLTLEVFVSHCATSWGASTSNAA